MTTPAGCFTLGHVVIAGVGVSAQEAATLHPEPAA